MQKTDRFKYLLRALRGGFSLMILAMLNNIFFELIKKQVVIKKVQK